MIGALQNANNSFSLSGNNRFSQYPQHNQFSQFQRYNQPFRPMYRNNYGSNFYPNHNPDSNINYSNYRYNSNYDYNNNANPNYNAYSNNFNRMRYEDRVRQFNRENDYLRRFANAPSGYNDLRENLNQNPPNNFRRNFGNDRNNQINSFSLNRKSEPSQEN